MMHGCRRSRSTGGGGGTVQVKGYRRANGTYVAGYTRSLPRKTSSTTPTTSGKRTSCASAVQVVSPAASSSGYSNRKTVYVRGYTKSNGTYVAGYFRSPPSSKGGSNSRSAANPHSSCASTSSVAGNCNSPASPHCPSNAKIVHVTGHTKSVANSTHVMSHIRLPPRITVKSVQVVPASRVTRSSQWPGTITQDTNTQVSKSTKFESTTKGDTDKMHPPVRRPRSDNIKPTESDLGKIPGKDILKQNPVSKLCNAMPTALVNIEAVIKQHPTARPDSVKSSDSETIQAKSEDVFKQRSPSLDVKGKQDCRSDEEVAQGSISLLVHDGDEFSKVAENFRRAWAWEKRPYPTIKFIFKVTNNALKQRWTAYRGTLQEKDVKELYHGTKLSCEITMTQKLCIIRSCGVCGISSTGLDPRCIRHGFQRFGNGFYLAPNSSKCNDYTQSYDGFKAILLCDVLTGRRYYVRNNRQHLQRPPTGYDSVYGNIGEDLNYEEQVVYKSEAVLPRYIIVYTSSNSNSVIISQK